MIEDAFAAASDAGPILAGRKEIAIVGDSFSAGEGADAYLNGQDTDANPCHRSRFTYLVEAFDLPDSSIVACSGAVIADLRARQGNRTAEPQLDQLEALVDAGEVEAVAMTIGGNDIGFGTIAKSCLIGRADCSQRNRHRPARAPAPRGAEQELCRSAVGESWRCPARRYEDVNSIVNDEAARTAAGGPVPIVRPRLSAADPADAARPAGRWRTCSRPARSTSWSTW